jgi:hypothetical protein
MGRAISITASSSVLAHGLTGVTDMAGAVIASVAVVVAVMFPDVAGTVAADMVADAAAIEAAIAVRPYTVAVAMSVVVDVPVAAVMSAAADGPVAVVDTLEVVADMLVAAEAVTPAVVDIAKARRLDQTTSGEAYSFAACCLTASSLLHSQRYSVRPALIY